MMSLRSPNAENAEIDSDFVVVVRQLCLQYALQLVKTRLSTLLELQTPLFCIAKQFSGSLYASKTLDAVYHLIDPRLEWKKVGYIYRVCWRSM